MKKLIAFILSAVMAFSVPAVGVFAASDAQGHWAEGIIATLVDSGAVRGYEDGTIRPQESITRAEFMATINNLLGFTEAAEINFTDVSGNEWFAADVGRAVAVGYVSGYPDGTMRPNAQITRQEAAAAINRLTLLATNRHASVEFTDFNQIAQWARGAVGGASAADILSGYPDGSFNPTGNITRAEAFSLILNARDYIEKTQNAPTLNVGIAAAINNSHRNMLVSASAGNTAFRNNISESMSAENVYRAIIAASEISALSTVHAQYVDMVKGYIINDGTVIDRASLELMQESIDLAIAIRNVSNRALDVLRDVRVNGANRYQDISNLRNEMNELLAPRGQQITAGNVGNVLEIADTTPISAENVPNALRDFSEIFERYTLDAIGVFIERNNGVITNANEVQFEYTRRAAKLQAVTSFLEEQGRNLLGDAMRSEFINAIELSSEYAANALRRTNPTIGTMEQASVVTDVRASVTNVVSGLGSVRNMLIAVQGADYAIVSEVQPQTNAWAPHGPNVSYVTNRRVAINRRVYDNSPLQVSYGSGAFVINSTGLYAMPGDTIVIYAPEDIAGVSVRIGIQTGTLTINHDPESWRRHDTIVYSKALQPGINRFSSQFGGILYFTTNTIQQNPDAIVYVSGAVEAIEFTLNQTCVDDWNNRIKHFDLPYGELIGELKIMTIPTRFLINAEDPNVLIVEYDNIVYRHNELFGLTDPDDPFNRPFTRKSRGVLSPQIQLGAMHSGYPFMAMESLTNLDNIVVNPQLLRHNAWGFYHEIGHNFQQPHYMWRGVVESTVNWGPLFILENNGEPPHVRLGQPDATGITTLERAITFVLSDDPDKDFETLPDFLKLSMYAQLRFAYGWGWVAELSRYVRENPFPPGTDQDRRDFFVEKMSVITGENLLPFFRRWGLSISEEAEFRVTQLNLPAPRYDIWMLTAPINSGEDVIAHFEMFAGELGESVGGNWQVDGSAVFTPFSPDRWMAIASWDSAVLDLDREYTGIVTIEFDYTPTGEMLDNSVAFTSRGATASSFAALPIIFRARINQYFDSFDGRINTHSRTGDMRVELGRTYRVRKVVNLNDANFDLFITDDAGTQVQLANGFTFRANANLTNIGAVINRGNRPNESTVTNIVINGDAQENNAERDLRIVGSIRKPFDAQRNGVRADSIVRVSNNNEVSAIRFLSGNSVAAEVTIRDGAMFANGTLIPNVEITEGVWYSVRLDANVAEGTMSVSVDNRQVISGVALSEGTTFVNVLEYHNGGAGLSVRRLILRYYGVPTPTSGAANMPILSNIAILDELAPGRAGVAAWETLSGTFHSTIFTPERFRTDPVFREKSLGAVYEGIVTIEFDVTPLASTLDAVLGFAAEGTNITTFGDMPIIVRLRHNQLFFDAFNGAGFATTARVPFELGGTYRVRIVVDIDAENYNVYIDDVQIANNFAYRNTAIVPTNIGVYNFFGNAIYDAIIENLTVNGDVIYNSFDQATAIEQGAITRTFGTITDVESVEFMLASHDGERATLALLAGTTVAAQVEINNGNIVINGTAVEGGQVPRKEWNSLIIARTANNYTVYLNGEAVGNLPHTSGTLTGFRVEAEGALFLNRFLARR